MRNNETGEFELVVGNRQLLSAFFIIVLLFAVAFAMGYVVGENARTTKTSAEAPAATPPQKTADTRPEPVAAAPTAAPPEQKPADGAPPADAPAQPTTQPARDTQSSSPPAASAAAPGAENTAEPPSGSYWQIIATANHDSAVTLVQTLRDKGFPAALTPGPNNLTRVLVGPYADTAAMGRAKTELEGAGFNRLVTYRAQK
jgi:cell division septation protein DedD